MAFGAPAGRQPEPSPPAARRLSSVLGIAPASPWILPRGQRDHPLVHRDNRGDAVGHGWGTRWHGQRAGIAFAAADVWGTPLPAPRGGEGVPAAPSPAAALGWIRRGNLPWREPTRAHILPPPPRPSSCARLVSSRLQRSALLPAGQGSAFVPPAGSVAQASLSAEEELGGAESAGAESSVPPPAPPLCIARAFQLRQHLPPRSSPSAARCSPDSE